MSEQYQLADLLHLMACLRHEQQGCPWDLKQTLDTIVPHTLDEVYEVIDAIDRKDYPHLQDELGDLLFQVVFYARICEEEQRFDFNAVVDGLVTAAPSSPCVSRWQLCQFRAGCRAQ